ncbi:hypothetical protein LQZ18_01450 [Lachnospiraceae bacterium ZAX-1]
MATKGESRNKKAKESPDTAGNVLNLWKIFACLLFGILFSTSLTSMHISESKTWNLFYNVGRVYDVKESAIQKSFKNGTYDKGTNSHTIVAATGSVDFKIAGKMREWNYVSINIEHTSVPELICVVGYFDNKDNLVREDTLPLKEGLNVVDITGTKLKEIRLSFQNQEGQSLTIKGVQLREETPVFTMGRYIRITMTIFVAYLLLLAGGYWLWKKAAPSKWGIHFYGIMECIQYAFILIGNCMCPICKSSSPRGKSRAKTSLFVGLILYMPIVHTLGTYQQYYKYHMLVCSIAVLWIAVLSLEKELAYVNWKTPFFKTWTVLIACMCISDFIVSKDVRFEGYILLFVMGFLYFVWSQMEQPQQLMGNFLKAIGYAFFIYIIWILITAKFSTFFGMDPKPEINIMNLFYGGFHENLRGEEGQIFKAYLRNLNLFGNSGDMSVWNENYAVSNGYLAMAYRYGVFAAIPFIMFLAGGIASAAKWWKKGTYDVKYRSFALLSFMGACLLNMVEDATLPFNGLVWLSVFISFGFINIMEQQDERITQKYNGTARRKNRARV